MAFDNKSNIHSQSTEHKLEEHRPKDKPSRMKCYYTSLVANNRFISARENVYIIKPIGKTHITNSLFIDVIRGSMTPTRLYTDSLDIEWDENFDELHKQKAIIDYWNCPDSFLTKQYLRSIEVLCEGIEIIGIMNSIVPFRLNSIIKLIKDLPIEERLPSKDYDKESYDKALNKYYELDSKGIIYNLEFSQEPMVSYVIKQGLSFKFWYMLDNEALQSNDMIYLEIELMNIDYDFQIKYEYMKVFKANKLLKHHFTN